MQRLEHPRVHVVAADQHGQLDDLALIEKFAQRLEHLIGDVDVLGHGVGEGERGALGGGEIIRAPPGLQAVARFRAQSFGFGQGAYMLAERVFGAVQMANADDEYFAEAAVQPGLPADRVVEIEPGCTEGWALQQDFINVMLLPFRY